MANAFREENGLETGGVRRVKRVGQLSLPDLLLIKSFINIKAE
jgi:hypothetical protein